MKRKSILGCIAGVFVLGIPAIGPAQNIGFQVGIVQPQFGFPPTQAPAVAVRGTFTAVPQPVIPVSQGIVPVPLVPNFPTVIVPNSVLVPGQTAFQPFGNPASAPGFPSPAVNPSGPPFSSQGHSRLPAIGTPRGDVLRQLGQPSVTVVTSAGETLYFTGGVTVILQNGQVISTK
jgi:hypothetical protein